MQTVLLTLIGPTHRLDLKLPAEVPIAELLPKILELCGPPHLPEIEPAQWNLILFGQNTILSHTSSLLASGVVDGAILLLQDQAASVAVQQQTQGPSFRPQALAPSANTGGIGVKWHLPNH